MKIVMSGSGTRLACFVGALTALSESGVKPSGYAGTSGGALIAAACACIAENPNILQDLLQRLMPKLPDLLQPSWFSLVWGSGYFRAGKLTDELKKLFPMKFREVQIPLRIIVTPLDQTTDGAAFHVFSQETTPDIEVWQAVRASMAIPLVFSSHTVNGIEYVDGGVTSNFALDVFGDEPVIGLNFLERPGFPIGAKKGLVERIMQVVSMMIYASSREHMEDAKHARVISIRTQHSGMNFSVSEENVEQMILDGYVSARQHVRKVLS